jgi:hypothetical protein
MQELVLMSDNEPSEDEINKEIAKKKYKWKAGKTSLSELPLEEQKKRLGFIPTEEEKEKISKKTEKC